MIYILSSCFVSDLLKSKLELSDLSPMFMEMCEFVTAWIKKYMELLR